MYERNLSGATETIKSNRNRTATLIKPEEILKPLTTFNKAVSKVKFTYKLMSQQLLINTSGRYRATFAFIWSCVHVHLENAITIFTLLMLFYWLPVPD